MPRERLLLSGPAGAGKSAVARKERESMDGPAVIVDFQSIYAALTGDVRGPDGRYPLRDEALLPTAEYVRRAAISAAREREIGIVATNSDGDPDRRAFLLAQLGAGAVERILDPGIDVVEARLLDPATGELSDECDEAIKRWYGRKR